MKDKVMERTVISILKVIVLDKINKQTKKGPKQIEKGSYSRGDPDFEI